MTSQKATLNDKTLWQLSIIFKENNETTTKANLRVRFIHDIRYEPPQGRLFIQDDYNGLVKTDSDGYSGKWTLSEDKYDHKDGLWIWGLFEEPKYPFLYFSMSK